MKSTDDFLRGAIAHGLSARLHDAVELRRRYRLMGFCNSHALAIARHGLTALLPPQVELIHGPGCPDCVLPAWRIDRAIDLVYEQGVTLCASADMLRVPGARHASLLAARAAGANVVTLDRIGDALAFARRHPQREFVYLTSGFEAAAPATAEALMLARALAANNFSVLCHHVLTPAVMRHLLADDAIGSRAQINGFLAPSHISQVIGAAPWRSISRDFVKPIVIAGPEAIDVLQAVLMLVAQINECRADTENQYTRVVTEAGDTNAQKRVDEVFEVCESFVWRGLGRVSSSALALRPAFARWDAERRYALASDDDALAIMPERALCVASEQTACGTFGAICTPFTALDRSSCANTSVCAARERCLPLAC